MQQWNLNREPSNARNNEKPHCATFIKMLEKHDIKKNFSKLTNSWHYQLIGLMSFIFPLMAFQRKLVILVFYHVQYLLALILIKSLKPTTLGESVENMPFWIITLKKICDSTIVLLCFIRFLESFFQFSQFSNDTIKL